VTTVLKGADLVRRRALVLLAAAIVVLGAALGGSGTARSAPKGALTEVKIGLIPIADVAPVYIGIKQGFFARQNIKITPQFAAGGAVIVPAVVSGDYNIGFSNVVSEILAYSKGLKLQVVANGNSAARLPFRAWDGILVPPSSPVRTPKDLEGKTIGINTLQAIAEVTAKAALARYAVDVNTLKFVEVPFPDMVPALAQGRVDAAFVVEPFLTAGLDAGNRVAVHAFEETMPGLTVATYFTTEKWAKSNPALLRRFVTAMNQSLDYARTQPDAVRAIVPTYTRITADAAAKIRLPIYGSKINLPSVRLLGGLMKAYGLLEKVPKLQGGLFPVALTTTT
jgi:NitT/TauT family transport system substrate-binding protein